MLFLVLALSHADDKLGEAGSGSAYDYYEYRGEDEAGMASGDEFNYTYDYDDDPEYQVDENELDLVPELLSRPLSVSVHAGEKVELPCQAEVVPVYRLYISEGRLIINHRDLTGLCGAGADVDARGGRSLHRSGQDHQRS